MSDTEASWLLTFGKLVGTEPRSLTSSVEESSSLLDELDTLMEFGGDDDEPSGDVSTISLVKVEVARREWRIAREQAFEDLHKAAQGLRDTLRGSEFVQVADAVEGALLGLDGSLLAALDGIHDVEGDARARRYKQAQKVVKAYAKALRNPFVLHVADSPFYTTTFHVTLTKRLEALQAALKA